MSEPGESRRIEAVVQAGPSESRYVRTGHGRKVLLLLPRQRTAWLEGSLVRSLAERYCVVVPEIPADHETTLGDWLAGFLDGTGYDGSAVVAEVELRPVLAQVAATDERIERIVFVDGAAAPRSIEALLTQIGAPRD